jgi:uncharacterized surface protein with fasciclin (FAS1) repeats
MMAQADDLKTAAEMISTWKIDNQLTVPSPFTLFMPVDDAFTEMPDTVLAKLKSLPVDYTYILMKAHIVRNYFEPTLLRIMNTVCPATLASEIMGTSSYHLNISVIGNTVRICTGVVEATVMRTVYAQHPIAIYAVSKVLLPVEMVGGSYFPPPPPDISPPPPPPPHLRSGQPPLLSAQFFIVLLSVLCYIICI